MSDPLIESLESLYPEYRVGAIARAAVEEIGRLRAELLEARAPTGGWFWTGPPPEEVADAGPASGILLKLDEALGLGAWINPPKAGMIEDLNGMRVYPPDPDPAGGPFKLERSLATCRNGSLITDIHARGGMGGGAGGIGH